MADRSCEHSRVDLFSGIDYAHHAGGPIPERKEHTGMGLYRPPEPGHPKHIGKCRPKDMAERRQCSAEIQQQMQSLAEASNGKSESEALSTRPRNRAADWTNASFYKPTDAANTFCTKTGAVEHDRSAAQHVKSARQCWQFDSVVSRIVHSILRRIC